MLSEEEINEIKERGIDPETVEAQIGHFKSGYPFIRLHAPAIADNGIHRYSDKETGSLTSYFDEHAPGLRIIKFVPASGAASRMFKSLFEFWNTFEGTKTDIEKYLEDQGFSSPYHFFNNLSRFAFYGELKQRLEQDGHEPEQLIRHFSLHIILEHFLGREAMDYGSLPKGLLLFHDYEEGPRLAVEEHLVEAAHYCRDRNGMANLHLTVSPEHETKFREAIAEKIPLYEKRYGVSFNVSFSRQKPSTDTIAVDPDNNPFRNPDGSLLFRPGGHGALIENLNDLDADIIFIKNIDNVVPDRLKKETYVYKKAIGGLLLKLQEQCFACLELLEGGNLSDKEMDDLVTFAREELNIHIPPAFDGYETIEKIDFLFEKLNRPMRVCGMVKNEGEPGGGPFWVVDALDNVSLQIVESSQIDFSDPGQQQLVSQSTHFNPVDLVCSVRDYRGNPFDLHDFIDPETGFISVKSKDGRELKALELPGLWNGAMADWITVFVETPIITFNPVKIVNDLLRPQHQPGD